MSDLPAEDVYRWYEKHLNPTLTRFLRMAGIESIEDHAEGVYIWDHEGKQYVDFVAGFGSLNFGHRHPRLLAEVSAQLHTMPLSSKVFFNPWAAQLAHRLAEILGPPLRYAFFGNSGAEAVECALKLVRAFRPGAQVLAFEGAFHGKTHGALSITGRPQYREPFEPLLSGVRFLPYGDLEAVRQALQEPTAGIFVEPIQGEGGVRVPPEGFLRELTELARQADALLVVDEIQTGMGRTGSLFAFQQEGIQPDIVTLGKSLGGGILPIGACVASERAFRVLIRDPLAHTSTFGGNPLAMRAGLAALNVLQEEHLAERAKRVGSFLLQELQHLVERHPDYLREARGKGLMIGLEFRDPQYCEYAILMLKQRGFLTAFTLNRPSVLRIQPPLTIPEALVQDFVRQLEQILQEAPSFFRALE